MATQFICQGCNYTLETPELPEGCNAKCPNCGKVTLLPGSKGIDGMTDVVAKFVPKSKVAGGTWTVKSYLPQSVLCMFLCCMPFGLVAVIYSVLCITRADAGDDTRAMFYSDKAILWLNLGLICGGLFWGFMLFWQGWQFWRVIEIQQQFHNLP